jgi:hypothetical protein
MGASRRSHVDVFQRVNKPNCTLAALLDGQVRAKRLLPVYAGI